MVGRTIAVYTEEEACQKLRSTVKHKSISEEVTELVERWRWQFLGEEQDPEETSSFNVLKREETRTMKRLYGWRKPVVAHV